MYRITDHIDIMESPNKINRKNYLIDRDGKIISIVVRFRA